MERLTFRHDCPAHDFHGRAEPCEPINCLDEYSKKALEAVVNRLAAYEDTGLEPEKIRDILERYAGFRTAISDETGQPVISWTRAGELVRADKEGRLVVLSKESIAARYEVAEILENDLKESSFYDPSVGVYGLTWAQSELWQAIIDGLNAGNAEAEAALSGGGDDAQNP